MKSILQEASTIAKAIEQGWQEAGQPMEFSIKILELPQRNFIGLTVRSAKIAFMFNGVAKASEQAPKQQRNTPAPRERRENRPEQPSVARPARERDMAPKKERPIIERAERVERPSDDKVPATARRNEALWSNEMVTFAQGWFGTALKHMERQNITFTIEPQHFYLRITLSQPILADEGQEKHLLASISLLMLSALKKEFRKALRGHKIVLTHPKD